MSSNTSTSKTSSSPQGLADSSADEAALAHVPLIEGLVELTDGAVLLCKDGGTIAYYNEAAVSILGRQITSGQDVSDLIDTPSRPNLFADAVRLEGGMTNIPAVVGTASGRQWVNVAVRQAGSWRIVRVAPRTSWAETSPVAHDALRALIEAMRDPLASIRAAAETMALYPEMDAAAAAQFMAIIEEETEALTDRLQDAVESYAELYRQSGPLEPVPCLKLGAMVREHLTGHVGVEIGGRSSRVVGTVDVAESTGSREEDLASTFVRVDVGVLTEVLAFLARRLENATRCTRIDVSVRRVRGLVALDLAWEGARLQSDRLREWGADTLTLGNGLVEMTLSEVVDLHDAQLLTQTDPNRIRMLLRTE